MAERQGEGEARDFTWTAGTIALSSVAAVYVALLLAAPLLGLFGKAAQAGIFEVAAEIVKPQALDALLRTALLTVFAVLVNTAAGIALGVLLARHRFFGRRFLDVLLDMPIALPPVMIGFAFVLVFGRAGVFAPLLDFLGIKVIFSFTGLLLAALFVTLPFTAREVANVLNELGTSEEEAAATLGASSWQTFLYVTLPNIRNALTYGVMLTTARSLGEFGAVLVLGGAITGKTQTATTFIYTAMEERMETAAYGLSLVLVAASMAIILLLQVKKRKSWL